MAKRPHVIVERDAVPVMFKRVADEQVAIGDGIAEVEAAIGSLRGRKCYGAFKDGEYLVCIQTRKGDDPEAIGLEAGSLPGGRYARVRLTGESPALYELIASTFETLPSVPTAIKLVQASSSTAATT